MSVTPDTPDFLKLVANVTGSNVAAVVVNQAANTPNVINLQPTTRYLFILTNLGPAPTLASCAGTVTQIEWGQFASVDLGQSITSFAVVPVVGSVDTSVTLKLGGLGPNNFWVVESPTADLFGLPNFPQTVTPEVVGSSYQSLSVANGAGAGFLLAPGAGLTNRIQSLGFAGGPTTVAATVRFTAHTSQSVLLAVSGPAGSFLNGHIEPTQLEVGEQVDMVNASGVSMLGWVSFDTLALA